MQKKKVLVVVESFLQHSQTYVKTELEALEESFEVKVLAIKKPNINCPYDFDCQYYEDFESKGAILDYIKEWKPDVVHTHYWHMGRIAYNFARLVGVPFTVRTHSFDIIRPLDALDTEVEFLKSNYCIGVLVFPFMQDHVVSAGLPPEKVSPCFPVINYQLFHDESPNGKGVMNTGACLPKKNMEQFIDIAAETPGRDFTLYPLGYNTEKLSRYNDSKGAPVKFMQPLLPEEMPAEYKKQEWLLYTADFDTVTVGWPMAIAEAQASGVGVLIPHIRDDLVDYVGGAGYTFRTIEEAKEILSKPYPEEMRQRGFEQAKKSDVREHIHVLTDSWQKFWDSPFELADDNEPQRRKPTESAESPAAFLERAAQLHRDGELKEARNMYMTILATKPNQPDALRLLGVLLNTEGRKEEAIEYIQQSISVQPKSPVAYRNLGDVLFEQEKPRRALRAYTHFLKMKPNVLPVVERVAALHRSLGQLSEASMYEQKARQLRPQ